MAANNPLHSAALGHFREVTKDSILLFKLVSESIEAMEPPSVSLFSSYCLLPIRTPILHTQEPLQQPVQISTVFPAISALSACTAWHRGLLTCIQSAQTTQVESLQCKTRAKMACGIRCHLMLTLPMSI